MVDPKSMEKQNVPRGSRSGEDQTREQILLHLQPFSHGAWAHMNINRIALFGRNLVEATAPTQYDRFHAAVTEYLEQVHPALKKIADQFQHVQFDPAIVQALGFHADELGNTVKEASRRPPIASEDLRRLELEIPKHVDQLLHALRLMRERIFSEFQCKPLAVLQSVVNRRQETDIAQRVSYEVHTADPHQEAVISEGDLRFVLETLIDGLAVQHRAGESWKVVFTDRATSDRWMLEVHDRALYFPPHLWRSLFQDQGGPGPAGLQEVPQILAKYDGDIAVRESEVGSGTGIVLRLRILHG